MSSKQGGQIKWCWRWKGWRKGKEKPAKYQDLARAMNKLWKTSVNVVPIVVGALGAVANL